MPVAQTIVTTDATPPRAVDRLVFAWTSDAGGAASGPSTAGNAGSPVGVVCGTLYKVEFAPGTGGNQPTDAYDVTLTDRAGVDVLAGLGANLSNAAPSAVCPGVPLKDGTTVGTAPCVLNDVLTLNVTNAGNAKSGQVIIYVR